MKSLANLLAIAFLLATCLVQSQSLKLTFSGINSQTSNYIDLQYVLIQNITQGCDTTVYGANPTISITNTASIADHFDKEPFAFELLPVVPNPFQGRTIACIELIETSNIFIKTFNLEGIVLAEFHEKLKPGRHSFQINSSGNQLIILNVTDGLSAKSLKILDNGTLHSSNNIIYAEFEDNFYSPQVKLLETDRFVFNIGDHLQFISILDGYYNDTITDIPAQDQTYNFMMTPEVADGFYIRGLATACPELHPKARMTVTRNEVTQTERLSLLELYIPLLAGENGFNIVRVNGNSQVVYGPGNEFAVVPVGGGDEVQVAFQRGPVTVTNTKFSVPDDGMYHVVIDYELEKAVIVPVHWGMIGAATPSGWSESTPMMESEFNLDTMEWIIEELTFLEGSWRFRYSDGWKVIVDPDVDIGGGILGVKVNTNLGNTIDSLIPGGSNIYNNEPGMYSCNLSYILGSGYAASLVKTANLPVVDYSDTELGLVGDGLIVDGNQHNWDVSIMLHTPIVQNETDYYWTWEDVEVSTSGAFKIREGQNWSGFVFGYQDVIMAGPSANLFEAGNDGNFVSVENGIYDFELKIDASNEMKTLTVNPAVR
jgi:hypothetical protein